MSSISAEKWLRDHLHVHPVSSHTTASQCDHNLSCDSAKNLEGPSSALAFFTPLQKV